MSMPFGDTAGALQAGPPSEILGFEGDLLWIPKSDYAGLDGTEFREHFEGGEVELIRDGATVLRGQLVPEPSTAILLGAGLSVLAGRRNRRPFSSLV